MENMQYAEELVREFLVFRGFTNTLQAFEKELSTDIGKGFQVDKILNLIFSVYITNFQAEKLVGLLSFFKQCVSSSETVLTATLAKLEISILRYYIVHALQSGRKDKVVEFFGTNGNDLLLRGQDWTSWFGGLPALLKISSEKNTVKHLKKDIKQLNMKLSQLQALLEEKEAQLSRLKNNSETIKYANIGQTKNSTLASGVNEESLLLSTNSSEACATTATHMGSAEMGQTWASSRPALSRFATNMSGNDSISPSKLEFEDVGAGDIIQMFNDGLYTENGRDAQGEEDFPEVKVDFLETFLGHTSPISCCRFSSSGNNIASASVDGTVRIWTYDSSTPASRNATIYCGTEIMSLEWECKSDRLLLIGTADGGIKAWNVDAKRVVCDLNTTDAFPSVLDLKCSPVEPIFVSAAASRRYGSSNIYSWGFASLTVWNMKTWKAMTVLPLGEDPPAITSLCFNHNGKILAASAVDGMIHMFDMSAGLQITGWPAHDSAISSILFGPDETSIFSLGFCDPESSKSCRHEMALDVNGRRLLVTSGSVRAPIYQVRGHASGMRTLPHGAAITTVDWHPTLPMFLTGSADHSVQVMSLS
ncbi:WD repeat-containing protein 91-like protein [Citrus sinensis]|uniref:WD repeat-containing protein 91-like protein n=1 Tax=Citrus sinensis TaxID=2711 RepID=A0ACB8HS04_CITSI|nr:WD repeat-containing protein 91-like protein [Citrus sinensis]